jgi:hypothetical protein
MPYRIHRVSAAPPLTCDWYDLAWQGAETAELTQVRQEGSDHRPKVSLRLVHDDDHLYGLFQVRDRYVRAVNVGYQAPVCKDSCVEVFFQPDVGPGYFNLEMSAGGSFLFYYVRDHQRTEEAFVDYSVVDEACGRRLTVKTTLPQRIDPEIDRPVTWYAQFVIPVAALEPYCGRIGVLKQRSWRGNFYKCGDETSHPHWITWAPLTMLNYHLPECFDTLEFS